MRQFLLFILLGTTVCISSCCHKIACDVINSVSVRFSGFSEADIDTIYRTGYAIGSGFTKVLVPEGDASSFGQSSVSLTVDHDWKIYIPALNRAC